MVEGDLRQHRVAPGRESSTSRAGAPASAERVARLPYAVTRSSTVPPSRRTPEGTRHSPEVSAASTMSGTNRPGSNARGAMSVAIRFDLSLCGRAWMGEHAVEVVAQARRVRRGRRGRRRGTVADSPGLGGEIEHIVEVLGVPLEPERPPRARAGGPGHPYHAALAGRNVRVDRPVPCFINPGQFERLLL